MTVCFILFVICCIFNFPFEVLCCVISDFAKRIVKYIPIILSLIYILHSTNDNSTFYHDLLASLINPHLTILFSSY